MELADLDNQLVTYFNKSELRDLCLDLDINYENLPGETIQNKAGAIISFCNRRGRLPQLLDYCRQLHPYVSWPDAPTAADTIEPQPQRPNFQISDHGLLLSSRFAIHNLENDLIGRGSMGDVYRGIDVQTGTAVAVKILKSEIVHGNPQLVERFVREGEALRRLNHPNIVKMLAAIEEADKHYLIMEYVRGGSLRDLLDKQKQLPVQRVLKIGLELVDALTRAHHLNIIHRDLKPANVLLAKDGTPRLTDFGVAHMGDSPRLTQSGMMIGTLDYFSPEVCDGAKLDTRSDIWSFGVMLFEMLAGERPFTAPTLTATLSNILTRSPTDITKFCPQADGALADLINHMLEKDRQQRIPSIRQVGAALEAILQGREPPKDENRKRPPEREKSTRLEDASPTQYPLPLATPTTTERRNQLILLEKVKNFWIKGVLEKSEEDLPLIDLTWQPHDEAIDHPWGSLISANGFNNTTISTRDTLSTFIEADRSLLILGAPGCGKTITMLKLSRNLTILAEQDTAQPIPVILNLVSWAEEKRTLADWIVEELTAKYQIPRKMGRVWLENNNLLLLLDGLDGVPAKQIAGCITAINQFREDFGLTGIIVCSRTEAYEAAGIRLKLGGAIALQPLQPAQIDSYLAAAGSRLAALRTALQTDAGYTELQKMAQTPLMLNVMSVAYSHKDVIKRDSQSDLTRVKLETNNRLADTAARRKNLFEAYIQHMFQHRRDKTAYSPSQTQQWLGWLAQKMIHHNQAVFLIEQLQPSWLDSRAGQWFYLLAGHSFFSLMVGLMVWLVLLLNQLQIVPPYNNLLILLSINLGLGLLMGIMDSILLVERRQNQEETVEGDPRRGWVHAIAIGIVTGGLAAIMLTLIGGEPENAIYVALWIGAFFIFMARDNGLTLRNQIRTAEALSWSWRKAGEGLVPGLIVGFIFTLSIVLETQAFAWNLITTNVIPWVLAFSLFSGLRGRQVEETSRPNQGIWLSARNSIFAALLLGTLFSAYFLLLGSYYDSYAPALVMGLLLALGGLFAFGSSVLEHLLVRFLLWQRKRIPWNISHFLDHAADYIFLYKVGGGYIFVNRALQEYFAALNPFD